VLVQPEPGGGLSSASATLNTMYGTVKSAWELAESGFALEVVVPANTYATVRLPDASLGQVTEGGSSLAEAEGITQAEQVGDTVVVEVKSGQYRFAYPAAGLFEKMQAANRLSSYASLKKLRGDKAAWTLLKTHFPEIADVPGPMLERAIERGSTLRQMAWFMGPVLTPERLDAFDQALVK
jgi:hypothetical protein